jgi:hypothetical protein
MYFQALQISGLFFEFHYLPNPINSNIICDHSILNIMLRLQKLNQIIDDLFVKFLSIIEIVFVASFLMLILGWIGYVIIDGYPITTGIRMHIQVITAMSSPFDPVGRPFDPVGHHYATVSMQGKIYGLLDLVLAWLFLPTVITSVISRAQNIHTNWKTVYGSYYSVYYNALRQGGKNEKDAHVEAIQMAKDAITEIKKKIRESIN